MLNWNHINHVRMFRVGTWMVTRPLFHDWRNILLANSVNLHEARLFAEDTKQRLTVHSAPINLASPHEHHQQQALDHLEYLDMLTDQIGGAETVIELHVGGWFDRDLHRREALERAHEFLMALPVPLRMKIALENDDKWNVPEIVKLCESTSTQFIYDIFHHKCWPGVCDFNDENIVRALWNARLTAGDRTPLVHISSQNPHGKLGAHGDLIEYADYARLRRSFAEAKMVTCDIMVEANRKEQAVLDLRAVVAARNPRWSAAFEGYRV